MKKAIFYYNDPTAPKPNKPNLIGSTVLIEYNKNCSLNIERIVRDGLLLAEVLRRTKV